MIKKIKSLSIVSVFGVVIALGTLTHAYGQCVVVAYVFETDICKSEIVFSAKHAKYTKFTDEQRQRFEQEKLASRIRVIASRNLLNEQSYTPTEGEIGSFLAFQHKSKEMERSNTQEIIATIEDLLQRYTYSTRNRKQLEDALVIFRTSLTQSIEIEKSMQKSIDDMRARFGEEAVTSYKQKREESKLQMARQWVSRWKMNKALYEKYGGRVIFQQAGIEPIDAYRKHLEDIRNKGRLTFVDSSYADVFDNFERYLDMGHNYLPSEGENYFHQPYWVTANLEGQHQKNLMEYKRIPHT